MHVKPFLTAPFLQIGSTDKFKWKDSTEKNMTGKVLKIYNKR